MSYKNDIKETMEKVLELCEKHPEIKTKGVDLNKIFGENTDLMDLYIVIDSMLEKSSKKSTSIYGDSPNKIKIFTKGKDTVIKIFRTIANEKEKTVCNITENQYEDRYDNAVITFDEIIDGLYQLKMDVLNGKGPYESCEPDYEEVNQIYRDEINKLPKEEQEKYMNLFLNGVRNR